MKNKKGIRILIVAILAILVFVGVKYSIAYFSPEIKVEGQILDKQTNLPLDNVLVDMKGAEVYSIKEGAQGKSETEIYTDQNGRFSVMIDKSYKSFPEFVKTDYNIDATSYQREEKEMKIKVYMKKVSK